MSRLIDAKELINSRPENLNPRMSDEIKSAYNEGWNTCNSFEEAIKRIEYLKNKAEISLNNIDTACEWLKQDVSGTIAAFSMAIEALEKQIPKKRTHISWTHYHCPVCSKAVNSNYCGNCGQAIDWSEEG